jgi:hypothetical protein
MKIFGAIFDRRCDVRARPGVPLIATRKWRYQEAKLILNLRSYTAAPGRGALILLD